MLFSINSSCNSPAAARDVTDHIWNAFLGGARRGVRRPFGVDAVPDGGAEQERFSDLGGAITGKPSFAVRENLCRAFSIGRTAKNFFAVRFI
jgi:hypothetical protein